MGKITDILCRSKLRDASSFPAAASRIKDAIDRMEEDRGKNGRGLLVCSPRCMVHLSVEEVLYKKRVWNCPVRVDVNTAAAVSTQSALAPPVFSVVRLLRILM